MFENVRVVVLVHSASTRMFLFRSGSTRVFSNGRKREGRNDGCICYEACSCGRSSPDSWFFEPVKRPDRGRADYCLEQMSGEIRSRFTLRTRPPLLLSNVHFYPTFYKIVNDVHFFQQIATYFSGIRFSLYVLVLITCEQTK